MIWVVTKSTNAVVDSFAPWQEERRGFGETVYFDISYSAVPRGRQHWCVLCIVSEMTERVRALSALSDSEARLRELNETLEQCIAERTRELEKAHAALCE